MSTAYSRIVLAVITATVIGGALPAAVAAPAEPAPPVQREIIPGSELMTSREREAYRQRMRGARTPEERERLRAEHVKAMEERGRMRGLQVIDHSRGRNKGGP
ncbi:MAG: hypothetical protein EHM16_04430 [Betaproteobacteria bacterium]|nr:MAG: hypothetical protein EHM16_04430 [Betaproteobacteria bacterium]